jgi:hypothetical protein
MTQQKDYPQITQIHFLGCIRGLPKAREGSRPRDPRNHSSPASSCGIRDAAASSCAYCASGLLQHGHTLGDIA